MTQFQPHIHLSENYFNNKSSYNSSKVPEMAANTTPQLMLLEPTKARIESSRISKTDNKGRKESILNSH